MTSSQQPPPQQPGPRGRPIGSRRQQFIIGKASGSTPPDALADLAAQLEADPEVEVKRVEGPAGRPDLVVAQMPEERAQQLREEHAGALVVEVDELLT
jgi:hypothetical protein